MNSPPSTTDAAIAPNVAAPQHGPRPLPLFLNILMEQTQHDPMLRTRALAGLRRYQEAHRPARPPAAQVRATAGAARLLQFGTEPLSGRTPVVVIPSLINPADVLDLSETTSLMRWLAAQGHDALMVDWGRPAEGDPDMDLAGHISQRLLPLLQSLDRERPPLLVGYCLGGTLAAGAAACIPVSGLVTIAAPWVFDGFPDSMRQDVVRLWTEAKPLCERLGYVPMELLQSGFWALDPARTIAKYAAFGEMEEGSRAMDAFLALEDWANAGPPLTYAAARMLFEDFYRDDATSRNMWSVDGIPVRPQDMSVPTLAVSSSTDRIVPAASAPPLAESWTLDMGHVGMIVGGRATERLWNPLSEWLFKHQGGC